MIVMQNFYLDPQSPLFVSGAEAIVDNISEVISELSPLTDASRELLFESPESPSSGPVWLPSPRGPSSRELGGV